MVSDQERTGSFYVGWFFLRGKWLCVCFFVNKGLERVVIFFGKDLGPRSAFKPELQNLAAGSRVATATHYLALYY